MLPDAPRFSEASSARHRDGAPSSAIGSDDASGGGGGGDDNDDNDDNDGDDDGDCSESNQQSTNKWRRK